MSAAPSWSLLEWAETDMRRPANPDPDALFEAAFNPDVIVMALLNDREIQQLVTEAVERELPAPAAQSLLDRCGAIERFDEFGPMLQAVYGGKYGRAERETLHRAIYRVAKRKAERDTQTEYPDWTHADHYTGALH